MRAGAWKRIYIQQHPQPASHAGTGRQTPRAEGAAAVGFFYVLARFVKLLLAIAMFLLFLRAILWPSALDLLVLLILFIVFVTLFLGAP